MTSAKKSSGKKAVKATVAKTVKKPATRSSSARKKASNKVDYYPNRMSFWVSAAAGSVVVLWAVMVAYS